MSNFSDGKGGYILKQGDMVEYDRRLCIFLEEFIKNSTAKWPPNHSKSKIYIIQEMRFVDVFTEYLERVKNDTDPT